MKKQWPMPIVLLLLCLSARASNDRRDGNWWLTQSDLAKLNYATGFFDGMQLGTDFSYWDMLDENGQAKKAKKGSEDCLSQVVTTSADYGKKYFSHVTNTQLVDGLDKFYSDYRNRRIRVHGAVWLVVNGIAGTPQNKLGKMIEGWRESSADFEQ